MDASTSRPAGLLLLLYFVLLLFPEVQPLSDRFSPEQPLSKIALHATSVSLDPFASIYASPESLGLTGRNVEWVTVNFSRPGPEATDWIGVFSPATFNESECMDTIAHEQAPFLCTSPIKFQYANFSSVDYEKTGIGELKFRLINQRADFAFAYFSGDLSKPILLAVSSPINFKNPQAPAYPRLALGQSWNELTVTWTSGYGLDEAIPLVQVVSEQDKVKKLVPASTLTYRREDLCGSPAHTVGWRNPGYFHTAFFTDLWPNLRYSYMVGHKSRKTGKYIWGEKRWFWGPPFPGQQSLQQIVIVGDIGKAEQDQSNEYSNYQPGSLNTTYQLVEDVDNIDVIFHIGDMSYANGYLSQWDQFTEQVELLSSHVPYMVASGNHERDWPNSGSFYNTSDSGGECGVVAETMYYMPAKNRAKFWYSVDYGMFHFCVADSEHDWRPGTEQYKFIEECLAMADRNKQPWLIFIAHRVLGYSSGSFYASEGYAEPYGRELEELWQKYKVDIAFFGHVHNYERTCPIYNVSCVSNEINYYSGTFNATIHVVVGGGGSHLSPFASPKPNWSLFRDFDFGFTTLTAYNSSSLLFEYKKSRDGNVYDHFWISRQYKDILGCDSLHNCPEVTTAT